MDLILGFILVIVSIGTVATCIYGQEILGKLRVQRMFAEQTKKNRNSVSIHEINEKKESTDANK